MSKYIKGDKVVMEITDRFKNAYGHEYYSLLNSIYSTDFIEEKTEFLTFYTEPLEAKIRRQAAEITRLLAENKRLWATNKHMESESMRVIVENNELRKEMEQAEVEGAEAAWELARKIILLGGYTSDDLEEIFNCSGYHKVMKDFTYPEAAAKVAEWEKAKEGIKVGDVVSREGLYGVVKSVSDDWLNGITASGISFQWLKRKCTKTGRHIDIDSFLKQIGEE